MALYSDPVFYFSGTDAAKFASPSKGMTYTAYDTAKVYTCFVAGFWTCTYSPTTEIYSNHSGTFDNYFVANTNLTGGSIITDTTGFQSVVNSGTTGTGNLQILHNAQDVFLDPVFPKIATFKIGTSPVNGTVGSGGTCFTSIGFNDTFGIYPISGQGIAAFLQKSDGTWVTTTADNAGIAKTENVITAPVAGDNLTVMATTKNVLFFKNGVLIQTHTTNLPLSTHAMYFMASLGVQIAAMGVSRVIYLTGIQQLRVI